MKFGNLKIHITYKYVYLEYETRVGSDNQTCRLHKKLILGRAAFGELKDIFKTDLPTHLKWKVFLQSVLPVLAYTLLTLIWHNLRNLQETNRRVEQYMFGLILREIVRNDETRSSASVEEVIVRIVELKSAGHLARNRDGRWTKRTLECRPRVDKRENHTSTY